jgi:hypothetical protein
MPVARSNALEVPLLTPSVGRIATSRTRGLLVCQGRDVQETPSGAVDALRPLGLIPSTLRACLHAWVYLLGMPFGLSTPGGQPVAV